MPITKGVLMEEIGHSVSTASISLRWNGLPTSDTTASNKSGASLFQNS